MKKIVLGVLFLALVSGFSLAEEAAIDFGATSLEELIGIRNSANEEIARRTLAGESGFYSGTYFVGDTMREGSYVLTCTYSDSKLVVNVYDGQDEYRSAQRRSQMALSVGESGYLSLKDGMVIVVLGGNGIIQPADMSWAP